MKPTKWGIIGPGNIAHSFARDLALLPAEQKIIAILGHSLESMTEFAQEFNVEACYQDIHEFVSHPGMEAVYIATPHTQHLEQGLACLENGLHVLCEKPMTINAAQTQELIDASAKHKAFLMEGMWIRFLPSIRTALDLINDNAIGNILSVKASMGYKAPHNCDSRYFDPALGGGSLLDLGIYPVFLAYLMLGKPHTIKAIGNLSPEGVDETCSVLFHYKGGQHAVLESSLNAQTDLPAEITGEKGIIKILDPWYEKSGGVELNLYGQEKTIYPCEWEGHGLQFEAEEVLNCLEKGLTESNIISHSFSLDVIEILDEIRKQIRVTYELYE